MRQEIFVTVISISHGGKSGCVHEEFAKSEAFCHIGKRSGFEPVISEWVGMWAMYGIRGGECVRNTMRANWANSARQVGGEAN